MEALCRELGVRYETEENAGRIYVDLTGGEGRPRPDDDDDHHHGQQPGHGHHGGEEGHRPRPSRPHHRPQEEEDLLTKAVRKLGECCIIM